MTPGTRLLNAARASTRNPSPREVLTERERELLDAVEALSDARALYPAAHAIGDRVSVKYPDGLGRQGVVVSVLSFLDGPDQHPATAYGVWLDGESRMNAQTYDSAFVHPAPRTLPLYRAPVVSGGPDWTVEDVVLDPQPAPSWFPMDGRRVTEESPGVSIATEARAFDPFDASFTDEERRGGERALDLFAAMLEARDPDDKHTRFIAAIRAEFAATVRDGDVSYMRGRISAFDKAVEIAGEVWVKR